ncbi:MAG: hypothetical protein N2044_00715 [Cyclobacteriaceae bacterium]|nr:hypothetical protein [Cyclobacteriaceae bacterium]MCX7636342.1 hypothetical protein [Cyclobacteriaceae bacterium]MDW8330301.1 hypothetical protein [Cyclobacteriaceae bacterium]
MSTTQRFLPIAVSAILTLQAFSQTARTPFSTIGIGQPFRLSLIHNQGAGGTGVAQPQYWFLNNQNPALLVYNYYSVFAAGLSAESITIQTDTVANTNSGGNLGYLVAAFPAIRGKWTTSAGLLPFTRVNYRFLYYESLIDINNNPVDTIAIRESGLGGLNQIYWSNGVRLHDNWSVGLQASHLFGSINSDYANSLLNVNSPVPFLIAVEEQTYGKGFQFTGGMHFSKDSLGRRKDLVISAGLTYTHEAKIKADKITRYERRNSSNDPITRDTLKFLKGKITLPAAWQFGLAVSKASKWSVAVEGGLQDWKKFVSLDEEDEGRLGKSWHIALGGEFTPDYLSQKLLDRVTYRTGFRYENSPFLVNGNQVRDFGINFGFSIPAGRSSIDLAFSAGQRGNRSKTSLEERYFRVYFGLTFNDQWFIRRKFD